MRRGRTAFILTVFASLALAPSAQAAFPGENGKIAVTAYEQRFGTLFNPKIITSNLDGSGTMWLTTDGNSTTPAWSADGLRIVFYRGPIYHAIYTMNADGTGVTQLTSGSSDVDPTWSPDGTKIVFSRATSPGGVGSLYVMNADGSAVTNVTSGPAGQPVWSPSGDLIAFTSGGQIEVIAPDGTGRRPLTTGARPDWSPDGRRIVFESDGEIHAINADGTGRVQLTSDPSPDPSTAISNRNPAWSPDGTLIAFVHVVCNYEVGLDCNYSLETISADGSGRASHSVGGSLEPDWQPIPAANLPPDCSGVTASPSSLRHHGFQTVTLAGATDPDGDAVTITITGVTQDEPVGRRPDARLGPGAGQVQLRGQRRPRGDGRVYRIAFTASDSTDECSGVATVEVRRHKKQRAVDSSPPSYDSFGE